MQPVLYAVLSDIHANYPALKAVEADAVNVARALDAQSLHFVVLGDVVDYGPQPNECMAWVEDHAEIVIQGNHDMEVMEPAYKPPRTISSEYWPITIWTRAVLSREHRERIRGWQPGLCHLNG
jgi:predicted phosphodiesterase